MPRIERDEKPEGKKFKIFKFIVLVAQPGHSVSVTDMDKP